MAVACAIIKPKYGYDFNETRSTIGLPQLPEGWELNKVTHESTEWINPTRSNSSAFYRMKTVVYNNDTILWESNAFKSPGYYTTLDGQFRDELLITYQFTSEDREQLGCEFTLNTSETIQDGINLRISQHEADSVLKSWSIVY